MEIRNDGNRFCLDISADVLGMEEDGKGGCSTCIDSTTRSDREWACQGREAEVALAAQLNRP